MKKLFPLIIIIAVILLAAYFLYPKFMGKSTLSGEEGAEKKSLTDLVKPKEETKSYTFKALKAAVELGIPLKCTYKNGDQVNEGFLKGRQWRGKIETDDGKKGEVILRDECMWSWAENEKQGMTLCFEPDEAGKSVWDMEENKEDTDVEYNCVPALITDATFDPPKDVEFVDIEELTKSYMNTDE